MNATVTAGEAKRTRRLLILGIALIVAAVAITAGRVIHSRMQQARLMQDRPKDLLWGTEVYSPDTADAAQEKRAKYLAKANLLRDHWRVWAVAHQDLLRRLREASPNDTATLMRVYQALPSQLNASTGVTNEDVGVNQDDFLAGRGTFFSWQLTSLKTEATPAMLHQDPNVQATCDHYDNTFLNKLHQDFAKYHGIMLAESISAGSSRITLWVDGRITEMTLQDQDVVGKPSYIDGPEKQLVPAYDFLR